MKEIYIAEESMQKKCLSCELLDSDDCCVAIECDQSEFDWEDLHEHCPLRSLEQHDHELLSKVRDILAKNIMVVNGELQLDAEHYERIVDALNELE